MQRSKTNAPDRGSGFNNTGRPIMKALDGDGDGRWIMRTFLGGSGLDNNARATVKSSFWGRLRALWWLPVLCWAISAVIFTIIYLDFQRHSEKYCSTTTYMATTTRNSEATFQSTPLASHDQNRTAENLAVGNCLHATEEKQQDLQHLIADGNRVRSYCKYPSALTSFHLLECAVQTGRENQQKTQALGAEAPPRRIAFMFLTRGQLPHEPLWRRFFEGHEENYSLYVHTTPDFTFTNESFFYGHQVPSQIVNRFSITVLDAVRRLLAYSILDPVYGATNSWFVLACEATIPLHPFNFTYNYLMESQHSFVESFPPHDINIQWFYKTPEKELARENLRKGEMWMALQLRHALLLLDDWDLYYEYKRLCHWGCAPDEQYTSSLLGMKDPQGIENRTVVYVNWDYDHEGSPRMHHSDEVTAEWLKDIKSRTMDLDGQYHDTSRDAQSSENHRASRSCSYNGVANHTCFLFARKIAADAKEDLLSLSPNVLGY